MQVTGANRWAFETEAQRLTAEAPAFSDTVRDEGIGEWPGARIAEDEKLT